VKQLIIFFIMALTVMLQVSLLPALRPLGVVPNVALVIIVLVALNSATSQAVLAAAAGGLVIDMAGGTAFGLWVGAFVLMTLVVGLLVRAGVELDGPLVPLVLVTAGTVVMTLAIWSSLVTRSGGLPVSVAWGGRLALELVINLILTLMLRPLIAWALSGGGSRHESGG